MYEFRQWCLWVAQGSAMSVVRDMLDWIGDVRGQPPGESTRGCAGRREGIEVGVRCEAPTLRIRVPHEGGKTTGTGRNVNGPALDVLIDADRPEHDQRAPVLARGDFLDIETADGGQVRQIVFASGGAAVGANEQE